MAEIKSKANAHLEFSITFTLTQGEASALEAIAGYGVEPFLEVFYTQMGKAYLQPHESEMRNLFKSIKDNLPHEISKINAARKAINEGLKDFQKPTQ